MPICTYKHAPPKKKKHIHMKGDEILKLENAKQIPDLGGWGTTIFF
jgi:hypothetical protein